MRHVVIDNYLGYIGLRSISDFQLLTLERRKSVVERLCFLSMSGQDNSQELLA